MLRVEAAATAVFLALLISCLGCCATTAARSFVVLKFFAVVLLAVVFLFLPNSIFDVFGAVASGAAAAFLIAQAVLVIDGAYSWNENWFSRAVEARRDIAGRGRARAWQAAILVAAGLAVAATVAGSAVIFVKLQQQATSWVLGIALAIGVLELLFSITDYCEHGALLTSSVVLAYSVWLAYQALELSPLTNIPGWMRWVELVACVITMLAFARHAKLSTASSEAPGGEGATGDVEAAPPPAVDAEGPPVVKGKMAVHFVAHIVAALYITSALVPFQSWATFGLRTAALAAALLAHGWTLVAPKVLTGRSFV